MKKTRKIIAIVLVAVMMMAMGGITAFADGSGSITVNNAVNGETYNIYKMFDLTVDNESTPSAYMYSVNSAWSGFFAAGGAGADYITIVNGSVTINSGDEAALAAAAAVYAATNSISPAKTEIIAGDVTWTGLDNDHTANMTYFCCNKL